MWRAGVLFCICLLTAHPLLVGAREEKRDPETGRIRVIYLGDCIVQDNPSLAFLHEPWIDVTRIPASLYWQWAHELYIGESVPRFMRRYMPRTCDELARKYDVIILSDANVNMFQTQHLEWFKKGVEEAGLGLTMVGGDETFGGSGPWPSWGPTSVGEILPVDCLDGIHIKDAFLRVGLEKPDHPLLASLPLDESPFPAFLGFAATVLRGGASEIAQLDGNRPIQGQMSWPFLVDWDRDRGRVFAFTSDWTAASGDLFLLWDYYDDFCINLMLYVAGAEVPQDNEVLHQVRGRMREYQMNKIFLYAMLEFIEKFGAQTGPVERKILEAERDRSEADELYMDIELTEALARIEGALDTIRQANSLAAKAKDAALLHVYVIEWLAVSGISLLAGSVVYQLMIRRKMYREITTTKFKEGR